MSDEANLEAFRETARAWLDDNFPKSIAGRGAELVTGETLHDMPDDLALWCKNLGEKGWATPTWPAEYGGGGLSQLEAQALDLGGRSRPRRRGSCSIRRSDRRRPLAYHHSVRRRHRLRSATLSPERS